LRAWTRLAAVENGVGIPGSDASTFVDKLSPPAPQEYSHFGWIRFRALSFSANRTSEFSKR
jgi:hypothetical protein